MAEAEPADSRPGWGWGALLVLTTAASLVTLLGVGSGERPAAAAGALPSLGLSRAAVAPRLEAMADASWLLGGCHHRAPLLAGLPDGACAELPCLWSERAGANIDMAAAALQLAPLPGAPHPNCSLARGGQAPAGAAPPQVSLALLLRDTSAAAAVARGLLEAFLTANEAASAEFLVAAAGPPGAARAAAASAVGQVRPWRRRALRPACVPCTPI